MFNELQLQDFNVEVVPWTMNASTVEVRVRQTHHPACFTLEARVLQYFEFCLFVHLSYMFTSVRIKRTFLLDWACSSNSGGIKIPLNYRPHSSMLVSTPAGRPWVLIRENWLSRSEFPWASWRHLSQNGWNVVWGHVRSPQVQLLIYETTTCRWKSKQLLNFV